jgi:phosphoribosylformylglycinamidine synthase
MPKSFKATVHVFLKNGVLDVQGKAVEGALQGLGWQVVTDVRVGKVLEFLIDAHSVDDARTEVTSMCEKLLANTVIESYTIDLN